MQPQESASVSIARATAVANGFARGVDRALRRLAASQVTCDGFYDTVYGPRLALILPMGTDHDSCHVAQDLFYRWKAEHLPKSCDLLVCKFVAGNLVGPGCSDPSMKNGLQVLRESGSAELTDGDIRTHVSNYAAWVGQYLTVGIYHGWRELKSVPELWQALCRSSDPFSNPSTHAVLALNRAKGFIESGGCVMVKSGESGDAFALRVMFWNLYVGDEFKIDDAHFEFADMEYKLATLICVSKRIAGSVRTLFLK